MNESNSYSENNEHGSITRRITMIVQMIKADNSSLKPSRERPASFYDLSNLSAEKVASPI